MAHDSGDGIAEGKLDLVPMIDCVMLLLLFFILTTKFSSEEKQIANMLPTNKGQAPSSASTPVEPPQMVNICVYPALDESTPMAPGYNPSDYYAQVKPYFEGKKAIPFATFRVGGQKPIIVKAGDLSDPKGLLSKPKVDEIHGFIADAMGQYEKAGSRKEQNPVTIHCFSGLSWRFALVAYDAVRAYEGTKGQAKFSGDPRELENMREVNFAPPRIRNYNANELGNELYEIVQMK